MRPDSSSRRAGARWLSTPKSPTTSSPRSSRSTTSARPSPARASPRASENSNYLLLTGRGPYILTLYEKRVDARDLPFFLGLIEHLAARGVPCPVPVHGRDGAVLRTLCNRPAAITSFLAGVWPRRPRPAHCAGLGEALARMHLAGLDYEPERANALSVDSWRPLFERCRAGADDVVPGLSAEVSETLDRIEADWPRDLPRGVIHADLFPDNVFFDRETLSGLIDFYFACNDALVYDLAVCLNAWCFEPDLSFNVTKARYMIARYRAVRRCSEAEIAALPRLAEGAALRFLLTRLYDLDQPGGTAPWSNPRTRASTCTSSASTAACRVPAPTASSRDRRDLYRRRLPRQSGAGRLGRGAALRRAPARDQRRKRGHHQQPHGAHRRDPGAGSAQPPLRRRALHGQHLREGRDSPVGSLAGRPRAGAPRPSRRSRTATCGKPWTRWSSATT